MLFVFLVFGDDDMKKILILLISIIMIVFSGCGNDNKSTDNTNQNSM